MVAGSHRSSNHSTDRRAHRSHCRSPSASRSRHSSHHRSSKRRSASRSHSRERSRRSSRHRRHRRARSRSGERHKRRRRNDSDKRVKHRSRSQSKSKLVSKAKEKTQTIKKLSTTSTAHSSQKSETIEVAIDEKAIESDSTEVKCIESASESQQKEAQMTETMTKVLVLESKDTDSPVDEKKQAISVIGTVSKAEPEQAMPKPALNVSSIKADILKALADARSTIAVIKKNESSVPVAPTRMTSVINESKELELLKKSLETKPVEVQPLPQKASLSPVKLVAATEDFDMFSMAALDDHTDDLDHSNVAAVAVTEVNLQSNCDDAEGYYSTTIGEILDGKYRVLGAVGKGVFSTVLRCQCINSLNSESSNSMLNVVAIKLIRNHDVMRDAAQIELKVLKELGERDPRNKKHCIKLLDSFTHRNHVAMVFEPMEMNVREAMKKFGGKGGISIQAVRVFSKHLLIALNHLESCCIIHADIKPDNMLLDAKQTTIKLCDFGSAFKTDEGKQDSTPYLVSRFYRAPEIVLGLAYDKAVDMWSVGCCLYEMFTGKVLFPGSTNNEMLKFFMELKGKIPNKLIKKHRQAYIEQFEMEPHFTEDLKFCSRESDRVTGKPILRLMDTIKTKSDLASNLLAAKSTTDERKQVLELRSLLDRMLSLDPLKRISVKEALAHPFVKGS